MSSPISGASHSSSGGITVPMGLVFKTYYLQTDQQFARAYAALIFIGIAERILSFVADILTPKQKRLWVLAPHAGIYFVVAMIRFMLMIAVMNQYVPIVMATCGGLTIGQVLILLVRHYLEARRLKKLQRSGSGGVLVFDATSPSSENVDGNTARGKLSSLLPRYSPARSGHDDHNYLSKTVSGEACC
ncbi:hypothetical protein H4219_006145 [Mycoemilia scoparia]|uniref:Uncharacterized protein n=1 Tax=Mycoemilia scoparia TaxID=417184 RepID=A0A9W8DIC1_9FUNG|nr:hypothetical protein H4219_006145 [Mycoemilia scoparia]